MLSAEDGVCMLPVPAATALLMKDPGVRQALDLSAEWDAVSSTPLPMGCIVARREFVEEHPEAVDAFLDLYGDSISFMSDEGNRSEAAELVGRAAELDYHPEARLAVAWPRPDTPSLGHIVVATGGTSDMPVAEEAALTAEALGNEVVRLYDVGVAGIHRLLAHADDLAGASAIVAVAGMEGALASVVGGMAKCPVVAVPTSVGYGASMNGISALLTMINSCANGISVVNIDNGYGAGYIATQINRMAVKK